MIVKKEIDSPYILGQILQQGRLLNEMSQREMAKLLGTGQKWVWEMEQGKPGILMDRLFMMLDKTGVKLYAEIDIPTEEDNDRI
ncbi:MAG: helix-turn-helix domain-containing protein [Candidatus Methanoplasma sp.]|jgi:transcriptional regulator with XRE-family HTH domain|nr:helix-turn-helix domain-containing protein [Candidatus Methanoplasma sp.]